MPKLKTTKATCFHPKKSHQALLTANTAGKSKDKTKRSETVWIPLSEITRCSVNLPCHHRTCPYCNEFPYVKAETDDERKIRIRDSIEATKAKKAIRDAKREVKKGTQSTILHFFEK